MSHQFFNASSTGKGKLLLEAGLTDLVLNWRIPRQRDGHLAQSGRKPGRAYQFCPAHSPPIPLTCSLLTTFGIFEHAKHASASGICICYSL